MVFPTQGSIGHGYPQTAHPARIWVACARSVMARLLQRPTQRARLWGSSALIVGLRGDTGQMPATILITDDEVPIVELLADLLEDAGYRVVSAYNGVDALRLIERDPPSLLITDNMMPRLSGLQLIERLRDAGEPPFPIILMSAVNPDRLPSSISFVPKPFDLDQLLSLIDAHLATDRLA